MSRWRRRRRIAYAVVAAATLAYALRVAVWRPLAVAGAPPGDGYTRIPGVVHVHTSLSDGGGTPEDVIAAARAAGLGFVVLTDHNNLDAKPVEGYHDGLLVVVGTEVSTGAGHVLGLGIPDPSFRFSGDAGDALEDIRDLGGLAFAAHPTSPVEAFRWTGWELPGPWGLELINGDSQWRAAGWVRLARTVVTYGLNRRYALLTSLSPPGETLALWDRMLGERDVAGLAGADAHSRVPVMGQSALRFPGYEALFGLVRNYVVLDAPLSQDAGADTAAVLGALGRGRSYASVDALADGSGFSFTVDGPGGPWTMGDVVPAGPGLRLAAGGRVPEGARVRVVQDGRVVTESVGAAAVPDLAPGVYRVEVRVPGWDVPWLLSNAITVADAATAQRRRERAGWPPAVPAPEPAQVLDAFEGATAFQPGSDPASSVDAPILDPEAGHDGGGAARLAFALAAPGPDRPHTFCALVDWTHRDLRGRTGLVFRIRADGVYRIWVQVRDANPASADEGTEWWFASVRTAPEWRQVAVPFARLRSINPRTDGRLDLDRVRALVFVLDRGAVKPGTHGTIWIDDLGVY